MDVMGRRRRAKGKGGDSVFKRGGDEVSAQKTNK